MKGSFSDFVFVGRKTRKLPGGRLHPADLSFIKPACFPKRLKPKLLVVDFVEQSQCPGGFQVAVGVVKGSI